MGCVGFRKGDLGTCILVCICGFLDLEFVKKKIVSSFPRDHGMHLHYQWYLLLTLRLLVLYIYMEHLFLMFLDHTQRRSTVGRTPLDE